MKLSEHSNLWRQAAVVGGTLAIAALIGLRVQSRLAWLPALAAIGLLGLVVLLRYLPWGLVALVPVSFLVDRQVGTGTNVSFNATFLLVLALVGVWVIKMVIVERQVRLRPTPANLPGLLFVGACLLGWLTSFLPWLPLGATRPSLPAQLGAFLLYALSIDWGVAAGGEPVRAPAVGGAFHLAVYWDRDGFFAGAGDPVGV